MNELKIEYNKLLLKYENGCKYLTQNKQDITKYMPIINRIITKLDNIIRKLYLEYNYKMTIDEIMKGFV